MSTSVGELIEFPCSARRRAARKCSETKPADQIEYLSSGFYWRKALREACWASEAKEIGLVLIEEVESLRQWVVDQGMTPPQFNATVEEAQAKGLEVAEETA